MQSNSSELQRNIMAVTAVVAGLMMIYVFPEQAMRTLKIALENVMDVEEKVYTRDNKWQKFNQN